MDQIKCEDCGKTVRAWIVMGGIARCIPCHDKECDKALAEQEDAK